jgi:hypothetical protein
MVRCAACGAGFDVVDGIPDLRVPTPAWVDFDRDKAEARRLAALDGASAEGLAREVFGSRPHWTEARIGVRTQQVLEGPARARREIDTWLAPAARAAGPLLEIGCGTGGLLAALPPDRAAIGIDVSLAWLVVAKRLLEEHGRRVPLAPKRCRWPTGPPAPSSRSTSSSTSRICGRCCGRSIASPRRGRCSPSPRRIASASAPSRTSACGGSAGCRAAGSRRTSSGARASRTPSRGC